MVGELVYDFADYAEDVVKDSFNLLRMFVHLYGRDEASLHLWNEIAHVRTQFDYAVVKLASATLTALQGAADCWWQKLMMPKPLAA